MEKFKGQGIIEYFDQFKTYLDCLEFLTNSKWKDGFKSVKCEHTKFTIRKANLAGNYNRCHHFNK